MDNYNINDVKKTKQILIVKYSFINKFHIEQIKSTINFINNIIEININFWFIIKTFHFVNDIEIVKKKKFQQKKFILQC